MKKITLVLLFVIGFTALSCSKSSNHDDVTENTTKTLDETAINTEKVIGKWEPIKTLYLDANHNQIGEESWVNKNVPCPSEIYEFIKGGSYVYVYYSEDKGVCSKREMKGSWDIKGNELTILIKGNERDPDQKVIMKITALDGSVFQNEVTMLRSDEYKDYPNAVSKKNYSVRKN